MFKMSLTLDAELFDSTKEQEQAINRAVAEIEGLSDVNVRPSEYGLVFFGETREELLVVRKKAMAILKRLSNETGLNFTQDAMLVAVDENNADVVVFSYEEIEESGGNYESWRRRVW